jgi:DNA-binding response OmpR family regulator
METTHAADLSAATSRFSVVLFEPDNSIRDHMQLTLTMQGFDVYACGDTADLFNWMDGHRAYLALLGESTPPALLLDIVLPRLAVDYDAGIVVQVPDTGSDLRLAALRAGADICLDRRYDGPELAALLRAMGRRAAHARRRGRPLSSDEPWSLLYQGWVLAAPGGARINLTGIERTCLECLLTHPQRELSRETLRELLPSSNLRSVNVAISRLRKKVQDAGVRLPLHTVHGVGYVFVGQLESRGA